MNLNLTLGDLRPGDSAKIIGFQHANATKLGRNDFMTRLHEIGFLIGEDVEVLHVAPVSQDPISIRIKDATYALRRADARFVEVLKK